MAIKDRFKNLERGTQFESTVAHHDFSPLAKIDPTTYEGRQVNAISLYEKRRGALINIPDDEIVYIVNQRGSPKADFFEE